jgi:hypothetical protein
MPSISVP